MDKSFKTFLKHSSVDNINRSANPAIVRASTIYFNSIQEMQLHQKKYQKIKKLNFLIMADREAKQQLDYKRS